MPKKYWILLIILSVAAVLRFQGLWSLDVQSDAALYSGRALGWFDFLAGAGQTSPIVWFKEVPWWGHLSFADHPPLTFFAQFVFFKIFGDSDFIAHLPVALAGFATVYLLYFLIRKIRSENEALLAALLMGILSYAVWASRTGFLEGMEILFISLSCLFFSLFFYSRNNRYLYAWAAATALALLTKYTAVFLLPVPIIYLLIRRRRVFLNKHFWLACLLIPILLTPIIIYNWEVFQTRGHFDMALSVMLGIKAEDYSAVQSLNINTHFWNNLNTVWLTLNHTISLPMMVLFLAAAVFALYRIFRRKSDDYNNLAMLYLFFVTAMFAFAGASERGLPIILPFLVMLAAAFVWWLWSNLASVSFWRVLWVFGFSLIIVFELFYSVNTNLLIKPVGSPTWAYAQSRFYQHGFHELNNYLRQNVFGGLMPEFQTLNKFTPENTSQKISGREVILVDQRLDWFSRYWYTERYFYYYRLPFLYFGDVNKSKPEDKEMFEFLRESGATGFWVVLAANGNIAPKVEPTYAAYMQYLDEQLQTEGVKPVNFYDYKGEVGIKVYHFH